MKDRLKPHPESIATKHFFVKKSETPARFHQYIRNDQFQLKGKDVDVNPIEVNYGLSGEVSRGNRPAHKAKTNVAKGYGVNAKPAHKNGWR